MLEAVRYFILPPSLWLMDGFFLSKDGLGIMIFGTWGILFHYIGNLPIQSKLFKFLLAAFVSCIWFLAGIWVFVSSK